MSSQRRKTESRRQLPLAFAQEGRSESPMARDEGTVLPAADLCTESPTSSDRLMEAVRDPANLARAMTKVIANGVSLGVDGMRVPQLEKYFERVEIPKPDGGVRKLGKALAAQMAGSSQRYWHISRGPALNISLSRAYLTKWGLPLLLEPETKV
jgi:hypothetical protein